MDDDPSRVDPQPPRESREPPEVVVRQPEVVAALAVADGASERGFEEVSLLVITENGLRLELSRSAQDAERLRSAVQEISSEYQPVATALVAGGAQQIVELG